MSHYIYNSLKYQPMYTDENRRCGLYESKYREIYEMRAEILSKLTNGIEKYHTHAMYQKVIDSLARGADPIMIIEQLIDINIAQSAALIKKHTYETPSITIQY